MVENTVDLLKYLRIKQTNIYFEKYNNNKDLGSFILIDNKNNTVAYAMIL